MRIHEVINALCNGDFDDGIEILQEELNVRRRAIQSRNASTVLSIIRPGDICTLTDIRPKYLTGTRVEIVRVHTGSKYVECKYMQTSGHGRRMRYSGDKVSILPSCLLPSQAVLDRANV